MAERGGATLTLWHIKKYTHEVYAHRNRCLHHVDLGQELTPERLGSCLGGAGYFGGLVWLGWEERGTREAVVIAVFRLFSLLPVGLPLRVVTCQNTEATSLSSARLFFYMYMRVPTPPNTTSHRSMDTRTPRCFVLDFDRPAALDRSSNTHTSTRDQTASNAPPLAENKNNPATS